MPGPLEGVKILEVAQAAFVPSAAVILADWGADVIKVEHPERGDMARGIKVLGVDPHPSGVQYLWEILNRGKRNIALDVGHPEGREALLRLVDEADVFMTNFLGDARTRLADRAGRHLRPQPQDHLRTRNEPRPTRTRRGGRGFRFGLLLGANRHGRRDDAGRLQLPDHHSRAGVRRFAVRHGLGGWHLRSVVPA